MSAFRGDERFPVLSRAIQREVPGAVGVLVHPPYVFVIVDGGTRAERYWAPELLDGDVAEPGTFTLRPVPPNAPPLEEM